MHKRKAGAAFIALLACVLADQAFGQGSGPKLNSSADDLTKISSLLEEFRLDIIHKDSYALTAHAEPRRALSLHQQPGPG